MYIILDLLYVMGFCLALPYFLIKVILDPKYYQQKIRPRLGFFPRRKSPKPSIWVHGVSVGEVLAVENFVVALEERFPNHEVVLSTTTATGYSVAKKTFPGRYIFYYPIDFSWTVRTALDRVRPSMVLLVELEVWPNFLEITNQRDIPVMVINGRMTQKSFTSYEKMLFFFEKVFRKVECYCVQTPEYAERFKALNVPEEKIVVTGNLKYDNLFSGDPQRLRQEMLESLGLSPEAEILIGGSTHPGEEEALVDIFQELSQKDPQLHLILAPRHPNRVPDIVKMIRSRGLELCLRTQMEKLSKNSLENLEKKIILIDTIGELSRIYAVASVVFVGGSLIPRGGHNMLEPVALGKPVLVGPHTANFKRIVEFLTSENAIEIVTDEAELKEKIRLFLSDPQARIELAQNTKRAVQRSKGATQTTLREVKKHMPGDRHA